MKFKSKILNIIFIVIVLLLIVIPFFWFDAGEIDLGGDSTRIYFYNPLSYLENYALFGTKVRAMGGIQANYYNIPMVVVIFLLKKVFVSPTVVMTIFNSVKLSVGFLTIYLICRELLYFEKRKKSIFIEVAAILAGVFYVFFPFFKPDWDRALLTQNQIFVNPLLFYLVLKFFTMKKYPYLFGALIVTFIFSHNFSWAASPPFFAFFPISILFLTIYTIVIRKSSIPFKGVLIGLVMYVLLHLFHLIPTIHSLLDSDSNINERIFDRESILHQLDYFHAILPLTSLSRNLFVQPFLNPVQIISPLPFIVVLGIIIGVKQRSSTLLLTLIFFLLTMYLLTAKVGFVGEKIYETLFLFVPGFTMFRNFITQWLYIFNFFYSLLLAQTIYNVFVAVPRKAAYVLAIFLATIIVYNAFPLISGEYVNKYYPFAPKMKNVVQIDPKFEEVIRYIKEIRPDGKVLTLPYTDYDYQVISGKNEGAYVGSDVTGLLTGKNSFSGYFHTEPFSDTFLRLSAEKDFDSLKRLLGILQINYIFHNKDKTIYVDKFPTYPYEYMKPYMPKNQNEYQGYIEQLSGEKLFENEKYDVYKLDSDYFLPRIYSATAISKYTFPEGSSFGERTSFFVDKNGDSREVYIEEKKCRLVFPGTLCDGVRLNTPNISFEKINQSNYLVEITDIKSPFILVFLEEYHNNWELVMTDRELSNGNKSLFFSDTVKEIVSSSPNKISDLFLIQNGNELSQNHFVVNGYANGWYFSNTEIKDSKKMRFLVSMKAENEFKLWFVVSLTAFIITIVFFFYSLKITYFKIK